MGPELQPCQCGACGTDRKVEAERFNCLDAKGQSYAYLVCPDCGHASLDPIPDVEQIQDLYAPDYYGLGETKFSPLLEKVREMGFQWKVRSVQSRLKTSSARVLDIGCGSGSFLRAMAESGHEAYGTEIDGTAYERASRITGIQVKKEALVPCMFGKDEFDLVTLWHVLEHIPNPFETLKTIRRMLKENAWLMIEVPNFGSIQANCFGRHWFHLDPPLHLHQFTEKSLTSLLSRSGFSVAHKSTFSTQMGGYGFLQSTLNAVVRPRDLLYDMLRTRNRCRGGAVAKTASLFCGAMAAPFSAAAAVTEAMVGRGGVLRFECRPTR